MSQYLLNIASRNSESKVNDLSPSSTVFNIGISDTGEDFSEAKNSQDNEVRNKSIQPNEGNFQEDIIKNNPNDFDLNRTEFKERTEIEEKQKNFDQPYFSKYIERVETGEKNILLNNKSTDFIRFEKKNPWHKEVKDKVENRNNIDESVYVNKTISKVIPEIKGTENQKVERYGEEFSEPDQINETISEKKTFINPILEKIDHKKVEFLSGNLPSVNITPIQPNTDHTKQIHSNITNQPAPKLVIGKIVVEILPPTKAPTEKIIQRVAQTPSKDNFSKTNKLMFGLGQL